MTIVTLGTLDIERMKTELRVQRVGTRLVWVDTTSSTCDDAWGLLDSPDADGAVVLTELQTAGRGRLGRKWESPRGASLMLSVLLIDQGGLLHGGDVGLIGALAACHAISSVTELVPSIKWPNDVLLRGAKVGGVLVEARGSDGAGGASGASGAYPSYVLGIGINCLQQAGHFGDGLARRATSLDMESSQPIDRTRLAIALITELDRWFAVPMEWGHAEVVRRWQACSETIGQHVTLQSAGATHSGTVLDVDPSLGLIVQMDQGGVRTFAAADTTLQP